MPAIPNHYSKDFILLIESMLNIDPKKRPTTNKILRDSFIKKNIMLFLERTKQKQQQLDGGPSNDNSSEPQLQPSASPNKSEFMNMNRASVQESGQQQQISPQPQPQPRSSNFSIAQSDSGFIPSSRSKDLKQAGIRNGPSSSEVVQSRNSRAYDDYDERPIAAAAAAAAAPPKSPVKKGVRISDVVQNIETKETVSPSSKQHNGSRDGRPRRLAEDSAEDAEEVELEHDDEYEEELAENEDDYEEPPQRKYELTRPIKLGALSQSPVRRNNSESSYGNSPVAHQPKVKVKTSIQFLYFVNFIVINFILLRLLKDANCRWLPVRTVHPTTRELITKRT
jgi:hypothetical protein